MKNDEDRSKYLVTQRNKQFTIKHNKFMTVDNDRAFLASLAHPTFLL